MFNLIVSLTVIAIMVYFLIKNYQPHLILLFTGLFLLYFAIFFDLNEANIFGNMKSTGFIWFDPIAFFTTAMASRTANIGLIIMAASGYAKYMDIIGASKALATQVVKPLRLLRSPYLVLGGSYIIGQLLNIVIPSASGLALLLMVTIYPVLIQLGIPRISAAAVVATAAALDLGPVSGVVNMAADLSGMDVTEYFVSYQVPAGIVIASGIALAHIFFQSYMDKRDIALGNTEYHNDDTIEDQLGSDAPVYYLILPTIPLILLLVFSPFLVEEIRLTVPTAMFISAFIAIACEFIRHRESVKDTLKKFMTFYDVMGKQFARIVTLVVAGEVFARGLIAMRVVDMVIEGAQAVQFGAVGIVIMLTLFIAIFAILMGSGLAPFVSFAALAPTISAQMGIPVVAMLLPMQLVAGIARACSPITGVIVATAGVSNISPFILIRRTAPPMFVGIILTLIMAVVLM